MSDRPGAPPGDLAEGPSKRSYRASLRDEVLNDLMDGLAWGLRVLNIGRGLIALKVSLGDEDPAGLDGPARAEPRARPSVDNIGLNDMVRSLILSEE